MFLLFHVILLLSDGVSTAFQVTRGPAAAPTILEVQKRAPLVIRFSAVYFSGDPSKPRAAEIGFEARVDIDKTLWGFCPTAVFVASDRSFAGNCVDRHDCASGCGMGGRLTTFTWYIRCTNVMLPLFFADLP